MFRVPKLFSDAPQHFAEEICSLRSPSSPFVSTTLSPSCSSVESPTGLPGSPPRSPYSSVSPLGSSSPRSIPFPRSPFSDVSFRSRASLDFYDDKECGRDSDHVESDTNNISDGLSSEPNEMSASGLSLEGNRNSAPLSFLEDVGYSYTMSYTAVWMDILPSLTSGVDFGSDDAADTPDIDVQRELCTLETPVTSQSWYYCTSHPVSFGGIDLQCTVVRSVEISCPTAQLSIMSRLFSDFVLNGITFRSHEELASLIVRNKLFFRIFLLLYLFLFFLFMLLCLPISSFSPLP